MVLVVDRALHGPILLPGNSRGCRRWFDRSKGGYSRRVGAPDRSTVQREGAPGGDLARQGLPARRDVRRQRHQLRAVQRGGRAGRAVPLRRRGREPQRDADRADRGRRLRLALLPAVACSPASATATACTAPGTPRAACRCNPNKLLLDPYAKATSGEIDWDQSLFGYNFGDPDSRNDDDSAAHMTLRRGDQPVLRLGGRPAARTSPTTRRSSTRPTSRG